MREAEVKKSFGASVRVWRRRMGISQEELAERALLHRTYISDVERGARNVSLQSIERLARALGASLPSLFSYDTGSSRPEDKARAMDILYVEDEADEVMVAMQSFKQAKIANRIVAVHDGEAALDFLLGTGRFADRKPEGHGTLVLLDLDLPRINGLEVLQRIRKDPRTQSIPVVALCTSAEGPEMTTSLRMGANACIVKPLEFQKLINITPKLEMQWLLHHGLAKELKE